MKYTTFNNQVPRAPSTINKEAPSYEKLRRLFTEDNLISFFWADFTRTKIGYQTRFEKADAFTYLTKEELEAVCPAMHDMVVWSLLCTVVVDKNRRYVTARTIWEHCAEPSILVDSHEIKETYCKMPIEVKQLNVEENIVLVSCYRYRCTILQKDGDVIISDAFSQPFKTQNQYLYVSDLENLFPGCTKKMQLAIEIGLSENDVATYAFGKGGLSNSSIANAALPDIAFGERQ